eukprot:15463425-Alexandrium_andersonii.AAC.1
MPHDAILRRFLSEKFGDFTPWTKQDGKDEGSHVRIIRLARREPPDKFGYHPRPRLQNNCAMGTA